MSLYPGPYGFRNVISSDLWVGVHPSPPDISFPIPLRGVLTQEKLQLERAEEEGRYRFVFYDRYVGYVKDSKNPIQLVSKSESNETEWIIEPGPHGGTWFIRLPDTDQYWTLPPNSEPNTILQLKELSGDKEHQLWQPFSQ
ncbi:unnamed protein product [Rhizoctonia solani]|uniref:Uncharacterized protein n=1 Tax=Rhizoctonia solani TaxID=456999 RepID=A0A8H2ZXN1_9AGAM|nr:unnamed protein product [Rhizoctonia solani]